ncbi:MAG: hypothetical protein IPO98_14980 [Saprospiraceae bacterium]|nr:hypothetical protein [Saprospiraceae bacterium]
MGTQIVLPFSAVTDAPINVRLLAFEQTGLTQLSTGFVSHFIETDPLVFIRLTGCRFESKISMALGIPLVIISDFLHLAPDAENTIVNNLLPFVRDFPVPS